MRILDFTSSVDIATASHDIISTHPVPDKQVPPIKWGNMFAEDGKLHMFGGQQEYYGMLQDDGTTYDSSYKRPTHVNQLFMYDTERQEWEVTSLGLGSKPPSCTNIAYDADNKVGWVYGGLVRDDGYRVVYNTSGVDPVGGETELLSSLVRYGTAESKASYVEIPTNPVGHIAWGSMTFIAGVGEEGVLILFGGQTSDKSMESMSKIHVFDIASKTWYTQEASSQDENQPPDRVRFCTVLVSAEDKSSFNIFMYGGRHVTGSAGYRDVYVLSIPAFHWIYLGDSAIGKTGHSCHNLQEKYMISYRGVEDENQIPCDREHGGIQIFDMQTLEWTTKYEFSPSTIGKPTYKIPEQIYSIIGGGVTGHPTFNTPKKGWSDENLGALFANRHVSTPSGTETTTSTATSTGKPPEDSNPTPVGPIVGGVIGGIAFLIFLIVVLVIYFRRKQTSQIGPNDQFQDEKSGAAAAAYYGGDEVYPIAELSEAYSIAELSEVYFTPRAELAAHSKPVEVAGEPNFAPEAK